MAKARVNGGFEILRVWSALGIVAFHSHDGLISEIGYAGLAIFVMLSFYLTGTTLMDPQRIQSEPLAMFIRGKGVRLGVPWLSWICIYLALDLGLAFLLGRDVRLLLANFNPFYGTRIHLWYLPYILIGSAAWRAVAPLSDHLSHAWRAALLTGLGVFFAVGVPSLGWWDDAPSPSLQFLGATPGLFYGLALASISKLESLRQRVFACGVLTLVGVAAAIVRDSLFGFSWIALGLGLPLVCLAMLWPFKEGAITRVLAPMTLGIYLLHPVLVGLLSRIDLENSSLRQWTFVAAFAASAAVIWVVRKTPLRAIV